MAKKMATSFFSKLSPSRRLSNQWPKINISTQRENIGPPTTVREGKENPSSRPFQADSKNDEKV